MSLSEKVQPPREMNTSKSEFPDFNVLTSAVWVNNCAGVAESMGMISNVSGSIEAKAKLT